VNQSAPGKKISASYQTTNRRRLEYCLLLLYGVLLLLALRHLPNSAVPLLVVQIRVVIVRGRFVVMVQSNNGSFGMDNF
jgi:hypothetical protein